MKMRKLHAIKVVMAAAMFIGTAPYLCVTAAAETEAGSEAAEIEAGSEAAEIEAAGETAETEPAVKPARRLRPDFPPLYITRTARTAARTWRRSVRIWRRSSGTDPAR